MYVDRWIQLHFKTSQPATNACMRLNRNKSEKKRWIKKFYNTKKKTLNTTSTNTWVFCRITSEKVNKIGKKLNETIDNKSDNNREGSTRL